MAGIAFQLHQNRRALRRERIFRDRTNPVDVYDDVELYERLRFDRRGFVHLLNLIRNDIAHPTKRNKALSPEMQLCIALRFFASGSFQNLCGDTINVHKSTACRAIFRVASAIGRLMPQYVFFPRDPAILQQYKASFAEAGGFPNTIGCVDGTQIRIIAPSDREWQYVNRKGIHAINVQLMCGPSLNITNCVVRWPGSTHDSRILSESTIYRSFEADPPNGIILGDSGYPLKPWLMVPFLNPRDEGERRYNGRHTSTRSAIERCNGVLKRKFACLHQEIRMSPERACIVIKACIVLYNLSLRPTDEEMFQGDDNEDDDGEDEEQQPRVINQTGQARRNQLVNNYFRNM